MISFPICILLNCCRQKVTRYYPKPIRPTGTYNDLWSGHQRRSLAPSSTSTSSLGHEKIAHLSCSLVPRYPSDCLRLFSSRCLKLKCAPLAWIWGMSIEAATAAAGTWEANKFSIKRPGWQCVNAKGRETNGLTRIWSDDFQPTKTSAAAFHSQPTTRWALFGCDIFSGHNPQVYVRVSPLAAPDTEETTANEAAGGRNKAVHWQPEGRRAKVPTIIADS